MLLSHIDMPQTLRQQKAEYDRAAPPPGQTIHAAFAAMQQARIEALQCDMAETLCRLPSPRRVPKPEPTPGPSDSESEAAAHVAINVAPVVPGPPPAQADTCSSAPMMVLVFYLCLLLYISRG